MGFFFFEFVYIEDGFLYIDSSLNHWHRAYLIMIDDHFVVFLNSVGKNFIERFCISNYKGNWPKVLSLLVLCVV